MPVTEVRRRRLARLLTEVGAPVVTLVLLPIVIGLHSAETIRSGLAWGGVAALFFGVIPFAYVLRGVRLGRWSDHHVSERKQRKPVFLFSLASMLLGVVVLVMGGAPRDLVAFVQTLLIQAGMPSRDAGLEGVPAHLGGHDRRDCPCDRARTVGAAAVARVGRRRMVPGRARRSHTGAGSGRGDSGRPVYGLSPPRTHVNRGGGSAVAHNLNETRPDRRLVSMPACGAPRVTRHAAWSDVPAETCGAVGPRHERAWVRPALSE